ncbi:peptidoglycan editing factor PgeF [Yimella sp. cx-51]|uniref:peptidoglycan editing factor PgeF n=1 Tax=Yimella sp. cx-51 TaxID=2770551 RepID=UPI00165D32B9|nr:peptidoglycan editing factor PgeF [Yimella sp. cx-51]MBC9957275.1 peptidoglycan editing factor PgeF [Yimella sp. cx-51]QTH37086.1 peptidoglycan editing factor PgeF [Yimella sp. cx-51]
MFWWRDEREVGDWVVDLAFTDSEGGVSRDGYASLNLGAHVGDDPAHVQANRAALAQALEVPTGRLHFMAQVHGADVAVVPAPTPPTADGMLTDSFGEALVVLVADCTPVLLYDTERPLVAAVHAGRPGMVAGVVPRIVEELRRRGSTSLRAVVGPSVCARCYEVPEQMRADAAAANPAAYAVSWTGTPAIDVASGVVAQLDSLGVPIEWIGGCTREQPRLFSHRRDHDAGRFAGIVSMRKKG